MTWTKFWDMHSGGGRKLDWEKIYIEAPQAEAELVFYNRFDRSPNRVTCTCCGNDYSIDEAETLEQISAFQRGCDYGYFRPDGTECDEQEAWTPGQGLKPGYTSGYVERPAPKRSWSPYLPLDEYLKDPEVKVIYAHEIEPHEREGDLPAEGYVWVGD